MEKHNLHIRINPYAVALVDEGCPQETIDALTKMSELVLKKYEDKSNVTSTVTSGEDGLLNLSTSPSLIHILISSEDLISIIEDKLKPRYMNDVFTWFQLEKSIKCGWEKLFIKTDLTDNETVYIFVR